MEIKTIGTTTIHVNDSGRFYAEIDGKTVYRASIRTLERLIEADLAPLPVMISTRAWIWSVTKDELTRATKYKMKGKRSSHDRFSNVYIYDKDAMEELRGLLVEYEALSERWDAIFLDLTRVTPENLEGLRAEYAAKEES